MSVIGQVPINVQGSVARSKRAYRTLRDKRCINYVRSTEVCCKMGNFKGKEMCYSELSLKYFVGVILI